MTLESTPIVEQALGDPLRVPGDVGVWLRSLEREARALHAQTQQAVEGGGLASRAMLAVHGRLSELLDDERRSLLWRTIRRPLSQLVPGTPARLSLDRSLEDIFRRARQALQLHDEVQDLLGALQAVKERHTARLPSILADHLRTARLDEEAIANVNSRADIESSRQRMARVEAALAEYQDVLPPTRGMALAIERVVAREGITIEELSATLMLRRRLRHQLREHSRRRLVVQRISARHVAAVAAVVRGGDGRHDIADPTAAVIEQLVAQRLSDRERTGTPADAAPVIQAALSGIHNALFPDASRYSWRPPAHLIQELVRTMPTAAAEQSRHTILYAIPIGGSYVCLSPVDESVVRVYSRHVSIGRTVECQVAVESQVVDETDIADLDIEPLFDGMRIDASAWYSTAQRAEVEVLAQHEDRWFGRLIKRGNLVQLDEPAIRTNVAAPDGFKMLRPPQPSRGATPEHVETEPAQVVMPRGHPSCFLGAYTVFVRTAMAGAEDAWLRYPESSSQAGRRAIERERELLGRLSRLSTEALGERGWLAAEPICRAALPRQRRGWPLYAIPSGVREADAPTLAAWIRSSSDMRQATILGVARIISAVHEVGFALGSCDLRMFSFAGRWRSLTTRPVPVPRLVTAPVCAALGDLFRPMSQRDSVDRYSHLLVTVLPPDVNSGGVAAVEVDAWAFAAFCLDVLAVAPLAVAPATWAELWRHAVESAKSAYALPALARWLGTAMNQADGPALVLDLIERVASGGIQDGPAAGAGCAEWWASANVDASLV